MVQPPAPDSKSSAYSPLNGVGVDVGVAVGVSVGRGVCVDGGSEPYHQDVSVIVAIGDAS